MVSCKGSKTDSRAKEVPTDIGKPDTVLESKTLNIK
jgi:hypothetical protein